jgi:F-type H+-transporting ATPase subunit delta
MAGVDPAATARALYDALRQMLRDNGAEDQFDEVIQEFIELVRGAGPREALITSAVPLDQQQQHAIVQELRKKYGAALVINFEVDPAILGGLIIQVGDQVLDDSVRSRLMAIQQRMLAS